MDVFLLHCLLLAWSTLGTARRLSARVADRILVAALLAWGNLVLTSLVLSTLHSLGDPAWFFGVSGSLALATGLLSPLIRTPSPATSSRFESEPMPNGWLLAGCGLTLGAAVWALVLLAFNYQPNHEAALTRDLPRVMYYLGQGSLAHFATVDPRLVFLPFNYHLLLVFCSVYGQPASCLNFLNIAVWLLAGLAAFRLCRIYGCSANASLIATWLVLVSPPVLAQAASTTPDLAAGLAIVSTCLFARLWQHSREWQHALLVGLSTGLGLGTSLGALFLVPVVLLWTAGQLRSADRIPEAERKFARAWFAPFLLGGGLGLPFIIINVVETGSLLPWSLWRFRPMDDLVPVLLLLTPRFGFLLAAGWATPGFRRIVGGGGLLAAALLMVWSGTREVFGQPNRPLRPLLDGTCVPAAIPPLPLRLAQRLSAERRINVESDGLNERIFAIMAQNQGQRFTSRGGIDPASFNLISRSAFSRNAGCRTLTAQSVCLLLPVPHKPTAGVEFLATMGRGAAARDYYGLPGRADQTAPTTTNRNVLLTFSRLPGSTAASPEVQLVLTGLHAADQTRLIIEQEDLTGKITTLTRLTADGSTPLTLGGAFRRLIIKVIDAGPDQETNQVSIPFEAVTSSDPAPFDPGLPSGPLSLFSIDLVRSDEPAAITCVGLDQTEGPRPQWDLPYYRAVRQPAMLLRLAPHPGLAALKLSFSVRLQVRKSAELEILLNGRAVKHYYVVGPDEWLEDIVDLMPLPGENTVEIRDVTPASVPDWLDYLERYPDVKNFYVTMNEPLVEGARGHYARSGRAEGRTVQMVAVTPPTPGSIYFVLRKLQLEGFNAP